MTLMFAKKPSLKWGGNLFPCHFHPLVSCLWRVNFIYFPLWQPFRYLEPASSVVFPELHILSSNNCSSKMPVWLSWHWGGVPWSLCGSWISRKTNNIWFCSVFCGLIVALWIRSDAFSVWDLTIGLNPEWIMVSPTCLCSGPVFPWTTQSLQWQVS